MLMTGAEAIYSLSRGSRGKSCSTGPRAASAGTHRRGDTAASTTSRHPMTCFLSVARVPAV
ncbi:MAG: hypothetical protein M0C28_31755 [Candidatus Moduliflexus flocculans]|nr:hypothetical protein [Candidatus Moduliflexus flocculans]